MFDRIRSQSLAAAMGDSHRRFQQEEALFGSDHVGAALVPVSDDGFSVGTWFETEYRQLEATLSMLSCVARSHIAAGLAEDRRNVTHEFRGRLCFDARYRDAFLDRLVADLDRDTCLAVGEREQSASLVYRSN